MASISRNKLLTHPTPDHPEFTTVIYIMELSKRRTSHISQPWGRMYKIGITTNMPKRFASLRNGNPEIEIVWRSKPCSNDDARWTEGIVHLRLREYRVQSKHTREWFKLTDSALSDIRAYITSDVELRRNKVLKNR